MSYETTTVRVNLGERSYDIQIGSGILRDIASFVAARQRMTHVFIVTDEHVVRPYADLVAECVLLANARCDCTVMPSGEQNKAVDSAAALWKRMLAVGCDRRSIVVAVGGGVVGDLAGFVAATFARGLAFFQVPTTLLAQVDSSVGGKVGVNLPNAKNMVGAFWQPRGVLIDTDVLVTLPEREFRAGLGEVVKYGVILDAEFFSYLEQQAHAILARQPDVLRQVIARCCRLKADVVERDEREETGLRAVLNYGHTFCHAIETVSGYGEFLHGEAVAIGMMCAARLAERLGRIDGELLRRQRMLLAAFGLPVSLPRLAHDDLIGAMQYDKKVEHGRLRFVLPSRLGHVELVPDVPVDEVRQVLAEL